ncbi:MAG: hypothetical protein ACI4E4_05465 [Acetatifactor sp.]
MSAKTKIVVLHMKELIYTGMIALLGIFLIVMLILMFLPDDSEGEAPAPQTPGTESVQSTYRPGIYTTELVLGSSSIDVEVIVDSEAITSLRLIPRSDAIATMYPLLEPTFDSLCKQIYENQSLEGIVYSTSSKYTSLVLLEALRTSLDKARIAPESETE